MNDGSMNIPSVPLSSSRPDSTIASFPLVDALSSSLSLTTKWKCAEWTKERVRLRPACVDYRSNSTGSTTGQELGVRVVIALLAPNGSLPGNVVIPWDNNNNNTTNNNGGSSVENMYGSTAATGGPSSRLDESNGPGLALVPFALDKITSSFVSKPSLNCISSMPSNLDTSAANKVGDDTIDEGKEEKEDDARGWLQEELGGVAGHLASASLQSCARFVAEKSLLDVLWGANSSSSEGQGLGPAAQGQGLGSHTGRALHIDIAFTKNVEEPLVVSMSGPSSSSSSPDAVEGGGGGRTHLQLFLPLNGGGDERMSDAAVVESIQRIVQEAMDTVQTTKRGSKQGQATCLDPVSLIVISVLPHPDKPSENHHQSDKRHSDKRISQRSSFGNDMVPRWMSGPGGTMNQSPQMSEVCRTKTNIQFTGSRRRVGA